MSRLTAFSLAVALACSASALAQGKKSDSVVKADVSADKTDGGGKQTVTVTLKIDDGWHAYANPVPKDFPGIPVSVTVDAKVKPADVKVEYPKGKEVKDATLGNYQV